MRLLVNFILRNRVERYFPHKKEHQVQAAKHGANVYYHASQVERTVVLLNKYFYVQ